MNRPTSPRGGPRTSLGPPTEMTDEKDCKDYVAFPAPLLARPSRMERRCRVRELSSFKSYAIRLGPHTHAGGVLRRAAQPPLFAPQPLLLKLFSCRCRPLVIQFGVTPPRRSHSNGGSNHGHQSGQAARISRQSPRRLSRHLQCSLVPHGTQALVGNRGCKR